jgi:NitT/TauT family transport system substrate-binding protein
MIRFSGRFRRFGALMAALAFVLVACGGDDTPADTAAEGDLATDGATEGEAPEDEATRDLEVTDIKLATSPPDFDTLTDAYWIELLEEGGLTVETFEFESSPDTVRAVAAGEGDVINTSPLAIMQYIQQSGGGLTVIGVELQTTDYVLVAQQDVESLESLADGGIIGISTPGDLSDSLTRLLFEEAGVPVDGMQFAEIGGTSARVAALGAGQIDVGAAHAANGLAAAEEFDLKILANYADYIPEYAQRFLAANPEWLEANPNTAQFLVDKMIEAQRWAQENKEEYIALAEEQELGIPPNIAEETYDLFMSLPDFFGVNGGMDKIEPTMMVEVEQGNLDLDRLGPIDEWTDPRFVEDYLRRNGEYSG